MKLQKPTFLTFVLILAVAIGAIAYWAFTWSGDINDAAIVVGVCAMLINLASFISMKTGKFPWRN